MITILCDIASIIRYPLIYRFYFCLLFASFLLPVSCQDVYHSFTLSISIACKRKNGNRPFYKWTMYSTEPRLTFEPCAFQRFCIVHVCPNYLILQVFFHRFWKWISFLWRHMRFRFGFWRFWMLRRFVGRYVDDCTLYAYFHFAILYFLNLILLLLYMFLHFDILYSLYLYYICWSM